MAQFSNIANRLEGILNNELTFARHNQGIWEWFNALHRCMSQNRFTGTPAVYGPASLSDTADTDIEAAAVRLFGVLIDNSNAGEDVYVSLYNTNTVTPGTTDAADYLFAPRGVITTVMWPDGKAFSTALSAFAGTGTQAGLEAGTGVTGTNPTVVFVYTK